MKPRIASSVDMRLSDDAQLILKDAFTEAMASDCEIVRTEHVLFVLMRETRCHVAVNSEERGGTLEAARAVMMSVAGSIDQVEHELRSSPEFDDYLRRLQNGESSWSMALRMILMGAKPWRMKLSWNLEVEGGALFC